MRLTQILKKQHLDFMFKRHWLVQGKRVPIDTGIEQYLKEKGIKVEDALEFVKEDTEPKERVNIIGPYEQPVPLDENHPNYKEKPCLTLRNTNVLVEGISQAQVLTKTVIVENCLPDKIEELSDLKAPKAIHDGVKKAILSANVFDTEQKKLTKIKDPVRPAFNFPRILGISDKRRNQLLTNKLLQVVEKGNDIEVTQNKYVVNDVESQIIFNKDDDLIQFHYTSNILMTSDRPVTHDLSQKDTTLVDIPDLYPVHHTATLPPEHFYPENSKYPIRANAAMRHPHTTWLHYNNTEVNNLYELPVTESQVLGRSLTHAFTVAAAYAKQLYGEDVEDLPQPVHINCIQTDGQYYHFGVFELNTLNVDGTEGTRNKWFCKNNHKLYDSSWYLSGIPVLENYNPQVYHYVNAMYNC